MSQRTSRKSGCSIRWRTFCGGPVKKLSRHTTSTPRSSRCSHRCDPRNPAPPVTTARRTVRIGPTGSTTKFVKARLSTPGPIRAPRLLPGACSGTHFSREVSRRPLPRRLLQVALHGRLRAGGRVVGVLVVLPLRAALAQQVPRLVQVCLDGVHPGPLLVGVLGALPQLVLLVHEGVDAVEDLLFVHARSLPAAAGPKPTGSARLGYPALDERRQPPGDRAACPAEREQGGAFQRHTHRSASRRS